MISELALLFGISSAGVVTLLAALLVALWVLYQRQSSAKSRRTFLATSLIGGAVLLVLFALPKTSAKAPATLSDQSDTKAGMAWQTTYAQRATAALPDYTSYLADTDYYQLSDPTITAVADEIAASATSAKDAMAKALTYEYSHITYIRDESDGACFAGTAPSILALGKGQCDTQSIVLSALLRKMRIATKTVGGCVVSTGCILQSLFPFDAPKMQSVVATPGATSFSRAASGGLHAWVTAWDPDEGWLTLEETTGQFANTNCYAYHVEMFVKDDSKEDLCISKNFLYAAACQAGSLSALNQYGLGVIPEVSP